MIEGEEYLTKTIEEKIEFIKNYYGSMPDEEFKKSLIQSGAEIIEGIPGKIIFEEGTEGYELELNNKTIYIIPIPNSKPLKLCFEELNCPIYPKVHCKFADGRFVNNEFCIVCNRGKEYCILTESII